MVKCNVSNVMRQLSPRFSVDRYVATKFCLYCVKIVKQIFKTTSNVGTLMDDYTTWSLKACRLHTVSELHTLVCSFTRLGEACV